NLKPILYFGNIDHLEFCKTDYKVEESPLLPFVMEKFYVTNPFEQFAMKAYEQKIVTAYDPRKTPTPPTKLEDLIYHSFIIEIRNNPSKGKDYYKGTIELWNKNLEKEHRVILLSEQTGMQNEENNYPAWFLNIINTEKVTSSQGTIKLDNGEAVPFTRFNSHIPFITFLVTDAEEEAEEVQKDQSPTPFQEGISFGLAMSPVIIMAAYYLYNSLGH
ncbi:MAG TPA: hypothetical protein VKR58_03390, partial [Aquella sp.]|nr:hypothetical protein [Aquella sp.]